MRLALQTSDVVLDTEEGKMSSCEKPGQVMSVPDVSDSQPGHRHDEASVD